MDNSKVLGVVLALLIGGIVGFALHSVNTTGTDQTGLVRNTSGGIYTPTPTYPVPETSTSTKGSTSTDSFWDKIIQSAKEAGAPSPMKLVVDGANPSLKTISDHFSTGTSSSDLPIFLCHDTLSNSWYIFYQWADPYTPGWVWIDHNGHPEYNRDVWCVGIPSFIW